MKQLATRLSVAFAALGAASCDAGPAVNVSSPYGLVGLVILVLEIIAIVNVIQSGASGLAKVLWILFILIVPLIGVIVWFLVGPKK